MRDVAKRLFGSKAVAKQTLHIVTRDFGCHGSRQLAMKSFFGSKGEREKNDWVVLLTQPTWASSAFLLSYGFLSLSEVSQLPRCGLDLLLQP